jgi:serine/threonine protein kinase
MSAHGVLAPTDEELRAYGLGELSPRRREEVERYVAEHPDCAEVIGSAPDDEVVRHLRGAGGVPAPERRRSLLELAVEAIVPMVAGCAGALAGGAAVGLVGVAIGKVAEKAINFFGQPIANRWLQWLRRQPPVAQTAALAALADVSPVDARREAEAALANLAPQASEADRRAAADYVAAIPRAVRQSLLSDRAGDRSLLPSLSVDDSLSLLQLLPASLPPYAAPCELPGTAYQLEELIGSGGFGAVYRASLRSEQYLNRAIKFCLDRSLVEVLRKEKDNLERLIEAGGKTWSPWIVRLYGYDLEHETPYLVYEYVAGGDLVQWLAQRRARTGKGLTPDEVLALIEQVVEALAFAHQRGIVHRDLKPANVLVEDEQGKIKLADFGIGGVARRMVQTSRVGTMAVSALSAAEQVSLFRGAGTPLYMDSEQKEGKPPDPRHDLHSLGVMWYQLLVGDVTREMHKGWARELERGLSVPCEQVELIGRCVGWMEERPKDASELLSLLRLVRVPKTGEAPERTRADAQTGRSPESGGIAPTTAPPSTAPRPLSGTALRSEATAWADARNADTVEAYERFLQERPAGAKAEAARAALAQALRKALLRNLGDADLRRRYLAMRTAKQRARDRKLRDPRTGQEDNGVLRGYLIGVLMLPLVFAATAGLVLVEDHPGARIIPSWLAWTCFVLFVVVLGWLWFRIWRYTMTDRIGQELGPLPPGTPPNLDAARRYLLGDERPT